MAWLRLIRWKNLLIVFLTQLLAWWCVILPVQYHFSSAQHIRQPALLTPVHFAYICISTILIAAAGYIINDYFDIKIDAINRPEKVVLEKQIPRRLAILSHSFLNVIALILAGIVARSGGHYEWLLLQLSCTVLLWFYSTHFKRQFMTGNVLVALLTALTIITLIVYEPAIRVYSDRPAFLDIPELQHRYLLPNPLWVLIVYAFFAFVLTWMREIVKDMEDFKGDAEQGCITMPIKWGLQRSGRFAQRLGWAAVAMLTIVAFKLVFSRCYMLGIYTAAGIIAPLIWWILQLNKNATTRHYHNASRWLKIIMVLGIVSLIIYDIQYA